MTSNIKRLKELAFDETWQSAQAFRWATRRMSRKQISELLGISLYRVDKVKNTRACSNWNCMETVFKFHHCTKHMPLEGTPEYLAHYSNN